MLETEARCRLSEWTPNSLSVFTYRSLTWVSFYGHLNIQGLPLLSRGSGRVSGTGRSEAGTARRPPTRGKSRRVLQWVRARALTEELLETPPVGWRCAERMQLVAAGSFREAQFAHFNFIY